MPFKPSPNEHASHGPKFLSGCPLPTGPKPHARVLYCSSAGFAGLIFVLFSRGHLRRRRPFFPD